MQFTDLCQLSARTERDEPRNRISANAITNSRFRHFTRTKCTGCRRKHPQLNEKHTPLHCHQIIAEAPPALFTARPKYCIFRATDANQTSVLVNSSCFSGGHEVDLYDHGSFRTEFSSQKLPHYSKRPDVTGDATGL